MPSIADTLTRYRYRRTSLVRLANAEQAYSEAQISRPRAWARVLRTMAFPRKTVLFYPLRPNAWSVIYKLCSQAGYWISNDPSKPCDAVFRWEDETRASERPFRYGDIAINRHFTDISKTHVAKVFADVFGYDLDVDPTAYHGRVVKKSDENATHDGEIIDCPIPAADVAPGFVYQKAIDNRRDDAEGFYEYRVPIFGPTIPVVYVKYRPADAQFKEFNGVDMVEPGAVLSPEELAQLLAFTEALQMEYGELDVLRDREDGRIYVVDANNTPTGPARGFRPEQSVEALRRLQPAFDALLAESARRLVEDSVGADVPAGNVGPATPSSPVSAPVP